MVLDKINRKKSTVILIDPKGDLAEQIAKLYANHQSDRLIYFNPSLFADEDIYPILNPFDIPKKDEKAIELATDTIVETLEVVLAEIDRNSKFTVQMKGILYYTIPIILRLKDGNLYDLYRFLDDEQNQDLIDLGAKSSNPSHRDFFQNEFKRDNLKVSKDGIKSRLRIFLAMKGFTALIQGKSTLDLYKAIDEKKIIVFNLSKGRMGKDQSKNFGRIAIGLTLVAMMQKAKEIPNPKFRPQVHLFVDEFQNYITETISEILAEARAYGLHLNMATQLVGQAMNTDLEKLVMGNTDVKVLGYSGFENRRHFANYFGMKEYDLEVEKYKFWVRVEDGYPFILTPSKRFLDNKGSMNKEEWSEVLKRQKQRYYTKYKEPNLRFSIKSPHTPQLEEKETERDIQVKKPKYDL